MDEQFLNKMEIRTAGECFPEVHVLSGSGPAKYSHLLADHTQTAGEQTIFQRVLENIGT